MVDRHSSARVRPGISWLAAVLVAAAAAGDPTDCRAQSSELTLPPLPPGVEKPAEYAFGDAVMSRDLRAWGPVFDELALRHGKTGLRVLHLTLAAAADVEAIRRGFDREMIEGRRWRPSTPKLSRSDAWAYGYQSLDGRDALVLVGLKPRPGEGLVPLNILTTLPGNP
jgi:hypothetical protein